MSAKIYKAPDTIKKPTYNFGDGYKVMQAEEKRYEEEVRAWCRKEGGGKLSGEIISFPHADGYALYMVFALRPLELIHLEIGDEWQSQFAELMTAKKVKEMVESKKAMEKLFPPREF